MQDLLSISTYIFCGSVCLTMAITLLFIQTFNTSTTLEYKRIKDFLAYSALVDVFIDILSISLILAHANTFILDIFCVPIAYFTQLVLMSTAILGLIHAPRRLIVLIRWCIAPFSISIAAYAIGYLISLKHGLTFSFDNYLDYNHTTFATIILFIIYGLIFVELSICLYSIIRGTIIYDTKLRNYYSGKEVISGQKLNYSAMCFIGYFLLAAIDFILSDASLDPILMIGNIIIFLCFVIFIFNLQSVYIETQPLASFKIELLDNNSLSTLNSNTQQSDEALYAFNERSIMSAINTWGNRSDKPYLKDGILLAEVADELKITTIQLSFILNHSMKMNFNSWINNLRIEESKRLIKEKPSLTLSEIAQNSGFKDLSCYSKAFKKVSGESPSAFKKSCV